MNRLKSRQHLGRALDRAGGRRNFRVASELRKWISPILPWVYNVYIYICICNLWDYLFNLPRQESHFFEAWFHLVWKNDLGRDPVVCPSGSTDKSSAHPKSFNIKYTLYYIYTRIYVYIYIWYCIHICIRVIDMYTISYIYIISLPHIYIYTYDILLYIILYIDYRYWLVVWNMSSITESTKVFI